MDGCDCVSNVAASGCNDGSGLLWSCSWWRTDSRSVCKQTSKAVSKELPMGPALCGAISELGHCSQPGTLSGPILSRCVEHMRARCLTATRMTVTADP